MTLPEKRYTISFSIPVRAFWRRYLPIAAAVAFVAFLMAVFFVDLVLMPGVVGAERGSVKVPQVEGLSLDQAKDKFSSVGLLTEVKNREYNDRVPENAVISQSPESGERVKKGHRILVVVSRGSEFTTIPDLSGMSEHQARAELRKRGYTVSEVRRVSNDSMPADQVIGTEPRAGSGTSRETGVVILLSRGAKATSAEMPNIVGESVEEAQKKIEACGLKLGTIDYKSDESLQPGMVTSQSVPPGQSVPLETAVNITASGQ